MEKDRGEMDHAFSCCNLDDGGVDDIFMTLLANGSDVTICVTNRSTHLELATWCSTRIFTSGPEHIYYWPPDAMPYISNRGFRVLSSLYFSMKTATHRLMSELGRPNTEL